MKNPNIRMKIVEENGSGSIRLVTVPPGRTHCHEQQQTSFQQDEDASHEQICAAQMGDTNVKLLTVINGVARIFFWGGPIFRDLRRPTRFGGGGG